ncbi:MAG TPA: hypothetical protein VFZ34_01075 [Blastocatellia bacterium]|nr:hypothetical protein [Blastocatellia bacterium]
MESLELIAQEIAALDRHLSRRTFFAHALFAVAFTPLALNQNDKEFLGKVARTLIPAEALQQTGIDVAANIEYLLARSSAEHRAKVLRLLVWAKRVSFLYGGEQIAIRARTSRFVLVQKMSKALSALCLVAFWGDERALPLLHSSGGAR